MDKLLSSSTSSSRNTKDVDWSSSNTLNNENGGGDRNVPVITLLGTLCCGAVVVVVVAVFFILGLDWMVDDTMQSSFRNDNAKGRNNFVKEDDFWIDGDVAISVVAGSIELSRSSSSAAVVGSYAIEFVSYIGIEVLHIHPVIQ